MNRNKFIRLYLGRQQSLKHERIRFENKDAESAE
jgi:hypothetical protein